MSKLLRALEQLNLKDIVGASFYNRGKKIYKSRGGVKLVTLESNRAVLEVKGSYKPYYTVEFSVTEGSSRVIYRCECPAYDDYGNCKHIVAGYLYLLEKHGTSTSPQILTPAKAKPAKRKWQGNLDRSLRQRSVPKGRRKTSRHDPYFIFFSLQKRRHFKHELFAYKLMADVLPDSLIDPENLKYRELLKKPGIDAHSSEFKAFLASLSRTYRGLSEVGHTTRLDPAACVNLSRTLISALKLHQIQNSYYDLVLTKNISEIAQLGGQFFDGEEVKPFQTALTVYPQQTSMAVNINFDEGEMLINPELLVNGDAHPLSPQAYMIPTQDVVWLKSDQGFYPLQPQFDESFLPIASELNELALTGEEATFFLYNYLLPLTEILPITGDGIAFINIEDKQPQKQLYLTEHDDDGTLIARLVFAYDGHAVPYTPDDVPYVTQRDESFPEGLRFLRIYRNLAYEDEVQGTISNKRYGLKRGDWRFSDQPDVYMLRVHTHPIDFLMRYIPNLVEDGFEIFGEEELGSLKVNRRAPTMSISVSSGIDWFDLAMVVQFGDIKVQLPEIRNALRRKDRYIKLVDGSIGELPEEWLARYQHLFHLGEVGDESIRFDTHHLTLVDQLILQVEQVDLDSEFQDRLDRLKHFSGIETMPMPQGFVGELRPYQKAGYDWLHFLEQFDFGGCLADDMGLGKTVQVLAYLAAVRESQQTLPPTLIVMPRSLLTNWARETERFTPNLKFHTHFGPQRQRDPRRFGKYDLVFTTYGIMRRDIDWLSEYRFQTIVLDESQAIKSPSTQVSKAARLLKSEHRIAMSGTPVENSTSELWSQFAFLNPGLLGSFDYFKKGFGTPIERDQDQETAKLLQGMVYPFILRRTKEQVAPDLPPRTEEIVYTDMEPKQRQLYEKTRDRYRAQLLGLVEDKGVQGARMKVLEGLLRLRQICNDPRLVQKSYSGGSAKMLYLMEHLDNLATGGIDGRPHKALIFSQFVQMLKLVEGELQGREWAYAYLDGQTRKRQEQIDAFQNDPEIPFFLISLKAGGVGLNLTAADYVIHIDPWWNPAVEMQATDRTHRIGQDKPVFVYKLITRDSVEEKILELQQRKKDLVDQLITTESSFFKTLTSDDIQVLFS